MNDSQDGNRHGLIVNDISKLFTLKNNEPFLALRGVSFSIPHPAFTVICGPSGSGKTTLLKIIAGLEKPTTGTILFNSIEVTALSQRKLSSYLNKNIFFIFQEPFRNFIPYLTLSKNAKLIHLLNTDAKRALFEKDFAENLKMVELPSSYAKKKPGSLSSGEQQKLAILLTLMSSSKLILTDEPTGHLDSASATVIWALFKELVVEKGRWIISVTHDRNVIEKSQISFVLRKGLFHA